MIFTTVWSNLCFRIFWTNWLLVARPTLGIVNMFWARNVSWKPGQWVTFCLARQRISFAQCIQVISMQTSFCDSARRQYLLCELRVHIRTYVTIGRGLLPDTRLSVRHSIWKYLNILISYPSILLNTMFERGDVLSGQSSSIIWPHLCCTYRVYSGYQWNYANIKQNRTRMPATHKPLM